MIPGSCIFLGIYGFSCVFLLSMSGVFHLLPQGGEARLVVQRLDHAAIYLMIAGTITAVHSILFCGWLRWGVIVVAWLAAAAGIVFKTLYFSSFPELLGLVTYLAFGWLGAASGLTLWRTYGFRFVKPLLYGGLAYTIGAVLEFVQQPIVIHGIVGPHEIFHVAVLFGISYHWWFIHSSMVPVHMLLPAREAAAVRWYENPYPEQARR